MADPLLDPFRLRVLKAITAALKTITPANAYQHDLADKMEHGVAMAHVYRGRTEYGTNDPLPLVSILEHPRALEALLAPDNDSQRVGEWDLLIQGWVKDDPLNPTDPAHRLVADVIACLAKEGKRKGSSPGEPNILGLGYRMPMVKSLAIGSPIVRPADGVISSQSNFWLTLTLELVEDAEKPFA